MRWRCIHLRLSARIKLPSKNRAKGRSSCVCKVSMEALRSGTFILSLLVRDAYEFPPCLVDQSTSVVEAQKRPPYCKLKAPVPKPSVCLVAGGFPNRKDIRF